MGITDSNQEKERSNVGGEQNAQPYNDANLPPRDGPGLGELIELLIAVVPFVISLLPPKMLTYTAAIEYFVKERPDDPRIKRGALLRHRVPGESGVRIIQVFLDKNNQPVTGPDRRPYGRQLKVRTLDEELHNAFGKTDLIIVE